MTNAPPGWYPDSWDVLTVRWYDGREWTAHVQPRVPAPASRPRANPLVVAAVVGSVLLVTLAGIGLLAWLVRTMLVGVVCGEAPHYCD